MERENQARLDEHICPHLGCRDDPATPVMYATWQASCFALQEQIVISPEHQNQFCLKEAHVDCPFYVAAHAGPEAAEIAVPRQSRRKRATWVVGSILVVLLITVGALFFFQTSRGETLREAGIAPVATIFSQPAANANQAETTMPQVTPAGSMVDEEAPAAEPTATPTASSFRPVPPPP